jgi:hypothetical protein
MTWFEIRALLKERRMPAIPEDLVAAIEAQTLLRRAWWQSDTFRLRWVPALVGLATVFGALWLSRIQKHPDSRAAIPLAARPEPVRVTLHAFLPSSEESEVTDTEKGERREHSKS